MNRVIVFAIITLIGIAASFKDAFYGLLLYAFYTFTHPIELVPWTSFESYRPSFIVAAVVIFTTLMQGKKISVKHGNVFFVVLFLIQCYLSLAFCGYDLGPATEMLKMIIITVITASLITDTDKFRIYVKAVAFFLGFMGAYYGVLGLFSGSTFILGNVKGDNNYYACWLNAGLPIIWYAAASFKKAKWQLIWRLFFIANILTVILTFSRAGFLSLLVTLTLIFVNMKKLLLVLPVISLIGLFLFLKPEYAPQYNLDKSTSEDQGVVDRTFANYHERLETMREGPMQVSTAQSRVSFWKTAIAMANANPLFGVGLGHHVDVFAQYDTSGGLYGSGGKAIHNTFFVILADLGYPGAILFILIVLNYFISLKKIREQINVNFLSSEKKEFLAFSKMMAVSMVAFMTNAFFIDNPSSEIFWMLIGLGMAFQLITKKSLLHVSE